MVLKDTLSSHDVPVYNFEQLLKTGVHLCLCWRSDTVEISVIYIQMARSVLRFCICDFIFDTLALTRKTSLIALLSRGLQLTQFILICWTGCICRLLAGVVAQVTGGGGGEFRGGIFPHGKFRISTWCGILSM